MLPNMNPKQMAQMMRQFGIKTEEIAASKVVIHKSDGSTIVITEPNVMAMDMQGQKSFQIQGNVAAGSGASEGEAAPQDESESSEADVRMVMEQAHVSKEQAEAALEETHGDIAAAILLLTRD